jgi:hypothetical protein
MKCKDPREMISDAIETNAPQVGRQRSQVQDCRILEAKVEVGELDEYVFLLRNRLGELPTP